MALAHRSRRSTAGLRITLAVAALAAVSAVIAVLVSQLVFPHLSINNDEPIYRLQAEAISHGDLFLPTAGMPDAFRPWLAAVRNGHYVLKYPPFFPGLVALSEVLVGGPGLLFAALGAAAVTMTYLLGLELLGDRRQALVAAGLVAASPLALLLSGLVLPYMATFVLLEVVAWGLLRSSSAGANKSLLIAGMAFGLVFAMRPYDALLFTAPLAVYAIWRSRPAAGRARSAVLFGLPSLVGVGAFLVANAVMTGSPLRPPFALLEPRDALGFGNRRLYPTDIDHGFGPAQGIEGVFRHAMLLNRWVVGGTILLVLAAVTLARTRRGDPIRWVALAGAMLPAGYLAFWGPWNASVLWGGTRWVGPFYFLPLLIPLAMLGARGLTETYRWKPRAGATLAGTMAVFTIVAIAPIVRGNLTYTRQSRDLVALLARPEDGRDKLVLVDAVDPYLMHPSAVVANRWDLSGPVLHALSRGDDDIDLAARFPDRTPYRLSLLAGSVDPDGPFGARLERLRLAIGPQVALTVMLRRPGDGPPGPTLLKIRGAGTEREYVLGPDSLGRPLDLVVDPTGARLPGRTPDREYRATGGELASTSLELSVERIDPSRRSEPVTEVAVQNLPARFTPEGVEVLVPTGTVSQVGNPPVAEISASSPG